MLGFGAPDVDTEAPTDVPPRELLPEADPDATGADPLLCDGFTVETPVAEVEGLVLDGVIEAEDGVEESEALLLEMELEAPDDDKLGSLQITVSYVHQSWRKIRTWMKQAQL